MARVTLKREIIRRIAAQSPHLTNAQIAAEAGATESYVCDVLRKRFPTPSPEALSSNRATTEDLLGGAANDNYTDP